MLMSARVLLAFLLTTLRLLAGVVIESQSARPIPATRRLLGSFRFSLRRHNSRQQIGRLDTSSRDGQGNAVNPWFVAPDLTGISM